jgi:hypothetical protein
MLRRLFALLSLCLLLNPAAIAANLAVGDGVPPLTLADQFDKNHTLAGDTRWLLFSHDRAISDALHPVLAALSPAQRQGVVYVADISRMPALVSRLFAVPAMRGLPFAVWLARDTASVAALPREAGKLTVLALQDGKVVAVHYLADVTALPALLAR